MKKYDGNPDCLPKFIRDYYLKYTEATQYRFDYSEEHRQKTFNKRREFFEKFNIIWAYYAVYDDLDENLKYYIEKKKFKEDNEGLESENAFTYLGIPFSNFRNYQSLNKSENKTKIFNTIREESFEKRTFDHYLRSPKVYHNLPPYKSVFADLIRNTNIQNRLTDVSQDLEGDLVLIQAEEILFYIFCWLHHLKDREFDPWNDLKLGETYQYEDEEKQVNLLLLIRFFLSVEGKLKNRITLRTCILHELFNIDYWLKYSDQESSNTKNNGANRNEIDETTEEIIEENKAREKIDRKINGFEKPGTLEFFFQEEVLPELEKISSATVQAFREKAGFLKVDNDIELIEYASPFNLKSSWELFKKSGEIHDILVAPLHRFDGRSVFSTRHLPIEECVENEKSVDINCGALMVCYLKPLFFINGDLDENEDSNKGFYLTRLFCEFISKPIIESAYLKLHYEGKPLMTSSLVRVMARNLSHNIGSHVLSNLIKPSQILKQLEVNSADIDMESDFGKALKKVAKFNTYLMSRMDFLADLATGIPLVETIKDINKDIISGFSKVRFICDNISGNDKANYVKIDPESDQIRLVSIPNDYLGIQAFYVILENIIRNSAKYGSGKVVELRVKLQASHSRELLKLTIYDRNDVQQNLNDTLSRINERIDRHVIEKGDIRKGSWGIMEMKVAAAYLRKTLLGNLDRKLSNFPLLKAVRVKSDLFGYELYLLRPKQFLFVVENPDLKNEQLLSENGISHISRNDLLDQSESFHHQIVVSSCSFTHSREHTLSRRQLVVKDSDWITTKIKELDSSITERLKTTESSRDYIDLIIEFSQVIWQKYFEQLKKEIRKSFTFYFKDTHAYTLKLLNDERELGSRDQIDPKDDLLNKVIGDISDGTNHTCVIISHYEEADIGFDINLFFNNGSMSSRLYNKLRKNAMRDLGSNIHGKNLNQEDLVRIYEATAYEVAIFDERIQKHTYPNKKEGINLVGDLMKKSGLYVPTNAGDCDLNAEKYTDSVKQALTNELTNSLKRYHFVVIHIGVLERLLQLGEVADDLKAKNIADYMASFTNSSKIILTSGRGQVDLIPDGCRFIHFSVLSQFIIEDLDKLNLIKLLMSLRV